jgi:SAM-dependent methyltransferase
MDTSLSTLAEDYAGELFIRQTECPICAGASEMLHHARNINPENQHMFEFRRCVQCDHGWIDPSPTQGLLNHLYQKGSRSVIGEWGADQLSIPEKICKEREIDGKPGRYFELGVGFGHLYSLFVERGWQCSGVDPGDWAARFPNVVRSLKDVPGEPKFDLLVALDVLEHVANPISILQSLRELAAPNARLYCSMPNRISRRAKHDGENWRMLRPLGHVNYYSKKSITHAMNAARFRVRFIKVTDLCDIKVPRSRDQIKPALVEWLGLGDQLVVMAEAF